MKLTDDLQLIEPVSSGSVLRPDTMVLYFPNRRDGGNRAYIRFPMAAVQAHGLDEHTHVLIQANRKDFVLHFLEKPAPGSHRFGKLTKAGREISVAALVDALHLERGERFRIDFTSEGASIYASWPHELRERIAGVTPIRRATA